MVNAVKNAKVNSSLNQVNRFSSMRSHQALQASALVGRQVLVKYDTLFLKSEGEVYIAIELSEEISHVSATIQSRSGETVRSIQWNQVGPGMFHFVWDGKGLTNERCVEGKYKIKISAMKQGEEVFFDPMICANVDSVSLGDNGKDLKLNISGIGLISMDLLKII